MNVDVTKVERILDALLRRTEAGEMEWDSHRSGMVTTYSASLATGSILLRQGTMVQGELLILDDQGGEVFRQGLGPASAAAMAVAGHSRGWAVASKARQLLQLVEEQGSRSDQILSTLLDEIESA